MDAPWIKRRLRRPTPAFVIAMIALFVALGGTAGAVATQAVPLAKRALVADKAKVATTAKTALIAENAKKLGGQTSAQIVEAAAQAPGPAASAAALVSSKSVSYSIAPQGGQIITATCDAGSKVVGGGFSNPTAALAISAGSFATPDGAGWTEELINLSTSTTATGTVVAQCLK